MGKEKFVLKIVGKEMFFWVYVFVFWVDEIIVVFLKNMLKIRELCFCEGIFFMEIFGKGYVEDVQWFLNEFGLFISFLLDIFFVKLSDFYVVKKVFNGKMSLIGVLFIQKVLKDFKLFVYWGYVIVGFNVVGFEGEGFFEFENLFLVLNVNMLEDLKFVERIVRFVRKVIFGWEDLIMGW